MLGPLATRAHRMECVAMQPASCFLDEHIREALKRALAERDSTAAIIEELPLLRGRGRADLAFVNGELCGFEIKSEADSLVRLGVQAETYESVFEFNTLVAARKHLEPAKKRIPQTWGIIEVTETSGRVELTYYRAPERNLKVSNSALVRLLWKNECAAILRKAGFTLRPHVPVVELWSLAESLPTEVLAGQVREALKRRHRKVAPPQTLCDGSHTTGATE
jgi:hypothetical protein